MIERYTYSKDVTVILVGKVMQNDNGQVVMYKSTLESFLSRKKDGTYYVLFDSKEFKKLDINDVNVNEYYVLDEFIVGLMYDDLVNVEIFHDIRTDFEDVLVDNVNKKLKLM